jgi:Na+/proline symporter
MNAADVSAGLVLPYAAVGLLGKSGAVCTLIMIFMAVTSAASAQLIAVSSIFTYDIYKYAYLWIFVASQPGLTCVLGPILIPRPQASA